MDFIKEALNHINNKENTLYDIVYDLFFLAKLKESEENIKNGNTCTLEELKQCIDGLNEKF